MIQRSTTCLVCVFLLLGCKGEEQAKGPTTTESKVSQQEQADTHSEPANVVRVSENIHQPSPANSYTAKRIEPKRIQTTPEDVCQRFIDALQSGDQVTALQQLTQRAAIETKNADLEMQPLGDAQTEIEVMPAKFATSKQLVAQVDCRVTTPGSDPAVVTWLMSRGASGWKISGMTVQLENGGLDLLSFENPLDVARIKDSVSEPTVSR